MARTVRPSAFLHFAAAAFFALAPASPVQALPLIGDQTIVLLTADDTLAGLGVLTDPVGNADIGVDLAGRLEALFPITGGDADGVSGTVEHEGSGLSFSDGVTELTFENFVIDLDALVLSGDVSVDGVASGTFDLMDVDFCTDLAGTVDACIDGDGSELLDGFKLSFSLDASTAFFEAFGLGDLTGEQFGVARIDIRPIPEPATALLLAAALAGFALRRRAAER